VREVARYVWIESGGSLAHVSHVPSLGRPELLKAAAYLAATIEIPPPSLRPSEHGQLSMVSCRHKSHTNGAGMSICVANGQESCKLLGMIEN
jgi:hypothetical protein